MARLEGLTRTGTGTHRPSHTLARAHTRSHARTSSTPLTFTHFVRSLLYFLLLPSGMRRRKERPTRSSLLLPHPFLPTSSCTLTGYACGRPYYSSCPSWVLTLLCLTAGGQGILLPSGGQSKTRYSLVLLFSSCRQA